MEKKKKYNFVHVSLSAVEPPVFKELKNKDYVQFGDVKGYVNNWPQYVEDMYLRSPRNAALIDGKIDFIAGKGFKVQDSANITAQARAQLNNFILSANPDEDLDELAYSCISDAVKQGGYYLECIWSNDGSKIAEKNYVDFRYVRTNAEKDTFYYTEDWGARRPEKNEDFEIIPAFNLENRTGKQILAVNCSPSKGVYPLPPYVSCMNYIEADYELSKFDLSNIQNSFVPSFLINFNNGGSEEEAEQIEQMIEDKFAGSENAGKFIVALNENKDNAAEVIPITPSDLDKQYQILQDRINQSLLVSHKVINPILFGWRYANSGLGNNADELRVAHEAYQSRYAAPEQKKLTKVFNNIASVNGLPKALEVIPLEPIKEAINIRDVLQDLTQDERRELIGYDPLEVTPVTQKSQFSEDDQRENILQYFSSCGESKDNFEILSKKELYINSIEEFNEISEHSFAVVNGLTPNAIMVLNYLFDNPTETPELISQATEIPVPEVEEIIDNLKEVGAIEIKENAAGETEKILTEDGVDTIQQEGTELELRYDYVERDDVPPVKTKSRDFCLRLMAMNKLWTKEEINTLRNEFGMDVFKFRGGWYNNPRTGSTTPWCRHIWSQRLVRRR